MVVCVWISVMGIRIRVMGVRILMVVVLVTMIVRLKVTWLGVMMWLSVSIGVWVIVAVTTIHSTIREGRRA